MEPRGIFVIKDKENTVDQIEHLCKKYNSKNAANNVQSVAIFKYDQEEVGEGTYHAYLYMRETI